MNIYKRKLVKLNVILCVRKKGGDTMSNYNWVKIGDMVEGLIQDDPVDFNEEATYHLLRRYKPELPFSFDKYINDYKNELGVDFIKRREALKKIIMEEFDADTKIEFISYVLYYFHKRKLNRKKLRELENYLDENR